MQVWIEGGTYYLPTPLTFTPADSGTALAPIVCVSRFPHTQPHRARSHSRPPPPAPTPAKLQCLYGGLAAGTLPCLARAP